MTRIIGITNQKGGVGKSSTALAIGNYLGSKAGRSVLVIDLDPQGNLSHTLRIGKDAGTVWDVFLGSRTIAGAIRKAAAVDCLCSSPSLAGADHSLGRTGKEYILKEALEPVMDTYDYIVIDTAPALGILTINALAVCTEVVIPAQADIYSLQGIGQLYQTIEAVRKYCNPVDYRGYPHHQVQSPVSSQPGDYETFGADRRKSPYKSLHREDSGKRSRERSAGSTA
jgi:chromosome partitioning protein